MPVHSLTYQTSEEESVLECYYATETLHNLCDS